MTSLADAVKRLHMLCHTLMVAPVKFTLDANSRAAIASDLRLILDAIDRASPEAVRDNVALAIAECFLCQPKDMTWEDRSDELADAAIRAMELPDTAREAGR